MRATLHAHPSPLDLLSVTVASFCLYLNFICLGSENVWSLVSGRLTLNVMFLSSICVIVCIRHLFIFIDEYRFVVWIWLVFGEHLDHFQGCVIIRRAATCIRIKTILWTHVFIALGSLGVKLLDRASVCFTKCQRVSRSGGYNNILHFYSNVWVLGLQCPHQYLALSLFNCSLSSGYKVLSHCGFKLCFPEDGWYHLFV